MRGKPALACAVLACAALYPAYAQLGEGGVEAVVSEVSMSVPEGNALPWAFVEGAVAGHADGYPVIIQIYGSGGEPVHFAQVGLSEDGSYEHRFRVLDVTDGQRTAIFEGDYTVRIYKFVYAETL